MLAVHARCASLAAATAAYACVCVGACVKALVRVVVLGCITWHTAHAERAKEASGSATKAYLALAADARTHQCRAS